MHSNNNFNNSIEMLYFLNETKVAAQDLVGMSVDSSLDGKYLFTQLVALLTKDPLM